MKKPLYDQTYRQILKDDDSYTADRMKIEIAWIKLLKTIYNHTALGRFIQFTIKIINR